MGPETYSMLNDKLCQIYTIMETKTTPSYAESVETLHLICKA